MVCSRNIVLSSDGNFCAHCGTYAHITCDPSDNCSVCGQPFQRQERPEDDPITDAILPRALRRGKSGGPALVAGLMVVLGLLVYIAFCMLVQTFSHGH